MVKIVGPTGHRLTVQRTEVTQGEFEKLVGGKCSRAPLFSADTNPWVFVSFVFIFIGSALAAGGGIGGNFFFFS